jgi:hypothetical protein
MNPRDWLLLPLIWLDMQRQLWEAMLPQPRQKS